MTFDEESNISGNPPPDNLDDLVQFALSGGAGNARVIPAAEIPVDDGLVAHCKTCPSYGFSMSCTPHVSGPSGFRDLQQKLPWAVVIRLVVPLSALFSAEKRELGRFLHELVASVETRALGMGYTESRAFAGGSCKNIFCEDHPECRRLAGDPCRHPDHARPSMSGFGIDVSELMKKCGWPSDLDSRKKAPGKDSMSWLAGLVLIG
jgi:predicted metal-binding protein